MISIGVFAFLVGPQWSSIQDIKTQLAENTTRLDTAQKLKESRDALLNKYNSISKSDLDNIKTLLPDNVNNIRLIIQINSLASNNQLSTVRNVSYQLDDTKKVNPNTFAKAQVSVPYEPFIVTFETSGQYKNFLNFISDLEQNLRLIDITNVQFAVIQKDPKDPVSSLTSMDYKVSLKTYWLRQ